MMLTLATGLRGAPVPVGLSNSACFRNLKALIIWLAIQIWLGYGGYGNSRVTPQTTTDLDGAAGSRVVAGPHPPKPG
jgi:hypothetical protein